LSSRYFIIILVLILQVSVLVSQESAEVDAPSWFLSPAESYSKSQYLFGSGSGITLEQAKKIAMASLATCFATEVSVNQTYMESNTEKIQGHKFENFSTSKIVKEIKTKSNANLQFTETVKTWQSPKTKLIYTLIIMDKIKARQVYMQELEENEKIIDLLMISDDSPLQKFGYLEKAMELSKKSEEILSLLFALSPPGSLLYEDYSSVEKLILDMNKAASDVHLHINVEGDNSAKLDTALKNSLQKIGFSIVEEGEYLLEVQITKAPEKILSTQFFVYYDINITLLLENAEIFNVLTTINGGGKNRDAAQIRAFSSMNRAVPSKFQMELENYLMVKSD